MSFSNVPRMDLSQHQDGSDNERLIRRILFSKAFSEARKSFLPYEVYACEYDGGQHMLEMKMMPARLAEFVYKLGTLLTSEHSSLFHSYVVSKLEVFCHHTSGVSKSFSEEYARLIEAGELEESIYIHVCEGQRGLQRCVGPIAVSKRFYYSDEYAGSTHRLLTKAEYDEWVTSLLKHV
jgi:hypothetical protein